MSNKIKIKVGAVEIEYEGSEEFIKNDLLDLVSSIAEIYKIPPGADIGGVDIPPPDTDQISSQGTMQGTTGSFASKLKCKTGPDLILAAMANFNLVKGMKSASRQDIIDEIKTASAYYKQTYLKNLTYSLNNLIKKGKLLETTKDIYALEAETLMDLEGRVAQK